MGDAGGTDSKHHGRSCAAGRAVIGACPLPVPSLTHCVPTHCAISVNQSCVYNLLSHAHCATIPFNPLYFTHSVVSLSARAQCAAIPPTLLSQYCCKYHCLASPECELTLLCCRWWTAIPRSVTAHEHFRNIRQLA